MLVLELIASTTALYSKYLWTIKKENSWIFAMCGSFFSAIIAFLNGLNIWLVLELFSIFSFAYGYYKWMNKEEGLFALDYIAIFTTLIFCIFFTYKSLGLISYLQLVMTFLLISGTVILAINRKDKIPWVLFFFGHSILFYITFSSGLFLFSFFQILSIFNAIKGYFDLDISYLKKSFL